ncbi:MAG: NADH:flavin oxidoreductase [Thermoleophilia bacterium]|nr:NADH:flavin oxidoreductase [Thermoleophilia bacterium]
MTEPVHLASPLQLRGARLRNRIAISPMCQYSAGTDGLATDWHLVHLGARAAGGAGLVIAEATAVTPEGRISPADLGIWSDAHVAPLARIVDYLHSQGAAAGIQLAHAGRKAATNTPWDGGGALADGAGGWPAVGPSALAYDDVHQRPHELTVAEIEQLVEQFAQAARRAVTAGFDVLEVHGAHGYLLNSFLSPLSNHRTDAYGGSIEGRSRVVLDIVRAIRAAVPEDVALFLRVSAVDWVPGGWTIDDTVHLARAARDAGVDLVDCSSGGVSPDQQIDVAPGYQVPFARAVQEAGVPAGAVGLIEQAEQADAIVRTGAAELVLVARASLRDPNWATNALIELGHAAPVPRQYGRGYSRSVVAAGPR